jgi:predicted transcriptional regulator
VAPRDSVREHVELEAFLDRNADALRASIEKADAEFERGEYFTLDQVMADIDAQRRGRRAGTA